MKKKNERNICFIPEHVFVFNIILRKKTTSQITSYYFFHEYIFFLLGTYSYSIHKITFKRNHTYNIQKRTNLVSKTTKKKIICILKIKLIYQQLMLFTKVKNTLNVYKLYSEYVYKKRQKKILV